MNQQHTIVSLFGQGWSKRRIARELDLDRATVRKYLAASTAKSPAPQTGSVASTDAESPTHPHTGSVKCVYDTVLPDEPQRFYRIVTNCVAQP